MITSTKLLIEFCHIRYVAYAAYCNTANGMRYLLIKAFISRDQDEGLYTGGFLGEMIQWTDILTALNSFNAIVRDFE